MARPSSSRSSQSSKTARRRVRGGGKPRGPVLLFARQNYILMMLGVLAVVIGYTAMRLENEVDGFISLYVAPLLILGGYLEIIYAILHRPRAAKPADAGTA